MGKRIKIETLKQTQAFYTWELNKEDLTEKERVSYVLALGSIERIIKERSGGKEKHKKAVPQSMRRSY